MYMYKAFLGKGFGVLEENNHPPSPIQDGAVLHSSDCILVEEHDSSSPCQRVNWSTHTIHEFIKHSKRFPSDEFAFADQIKLVELSCIS